MKTYRIYWSFNFNENIKDCPCILVRGWNSSDALANASKQLNNNMIFLHKQEMSRL